MKEIFLIIFYLLNFITNKQEVLKCGEQFIENCLKCGAGENKDSCVLCKPNHFLFFHNLFCLPCDDEIYGQVGCGGNCDGSRYNETGFVFCEENGFKEGYYNINGLCFSCSDGSPGCGKCTIEKQSDTEIYKCDKCLSKKYKLENDGICHHCYKSNCLSYHFTEDYEHAECDRCIYNYYLNSEKECVKCKYISIQNGACRVCSDNNEDFNYGPCWCYTNYTKFSHSICVKCPDNCPLCKYNKESNRTECIRCERGYTLNPDKKCISCGEGCEYCFLGKNLKPICNFCFSGKFLSEERQCLQFPKNCRRCKLDVNNNILNCIYCDYMYALNSDYQCDYCPNIPEIGGDSCENCRYNKEREKYECIYCRKDKNYNNIFAYILNTFQCLSNTDPTQKYLYGCLTANYIEDKKIYECLSCKTSFIPIINKKICKNYDEIDLYGCNKAEDIGDENNPKYSCIKCDFYLTTIKTFQNTTKCRYRSNIFEYCLEGREYQNNKYECIKCVNNSHLYDSNICICNSDSFDINQDKFYCYKCDYKGIGNSGCEASEGCIYHGQSRLDCNKYKSYFYFSYKKGQCYPCMLEIPFCYQCHYEHSSKKLICDECLDNIFHYYLNREENKFQINNCEE